MVGLLILTGNEVRCLSIPLRPTRFDGFSEPIELGYMERERAPTEIMELGISVASELIVARQAPAILQKFRGHPHQLIVHKRVHEVYNKTVAGRVPDQMASGETVGNCIGAHYRIYLTPDTETDDILHIDTRPELFVTAKLFLREHGDKHGTSKMGPSC